MKPLTIAVDVDGPTADLHSEWLRLYNQDYDDDMTVEDITQWEMPPLVKPECGVKILDYLDIPTLYDNIKPTKGAFEGIEYLRALGHRIVFNSSCVIDRSDEKLHWLIKHGFVKSTNKYFFNDWMVVTDKSLINADILIDDRPKNIKDFKGLGILFDEPYNQGVLCDARLKSWKNIPDVITSLFNSEYEEVVYG